MRVSEKSIPKHETKTISTKIEFKNEEEGTFTGYGSIFGVIDSWDDIVVKGAYKKTLIDHKNTFPLLWYHQVDQPIGIIKGVEDTKGLAVEGFLNLKVKKAEETRSLMIQKAVKGLSIGFDPIKYDYDEVEEREIRFLREIKLWEISSLTFQACPGALVDNIKALKDFEDLSQYISFIKNSNTLDNSKKEAIIKISKELQALIETWPPLESTPKNKPPESDEKPETFHFLELQINELNEITQKMEVLNNG
jgi:HK97 family phage prohead protease